MLSLLPLFGLFAIFAWFVYQSLLAPAYLSPLSKIPSAHWSSHFSPKWFDWKCKTAGELKTLYAVHQRLGPIVRLGPHEVSVVSQEGLKKIYTAGLDKTDWYERTFANYGVQNLVCTLDHKTHSTVRKMIAGLYTKSHLHHCADLDRLSKRIIFHKLLPKLSAFGQGAQGMDVVRLFECVGVDFITSYIFGITNGTDFLTDEAGQHGYFDEWKRIRKSPGPAEQPVTESLYMDLFKAAISPHTESKVDRESQPTVAAKMYREMSTNAPELGLSKQEVITRCASEMVDHVSATQETNTITWTYILYRLSQRPALQDRLREELRTLSPDIAHGGEGEILPTPASIDSLSLLNAVVCETLRLHASNPARMRRLVPPAGLDLHGYFVPPDTVVSTNAYCLHRSADGFPSPFDWMPQRWLPMEKSESGEDDAPDTEVLRKWFWAFGSGPRGCIGQHFALQIIKLVVAAIYLRYTTVIVDDDGIEQSDSYNSGPWLKPTPMIDCDPASSGKGCFPRHTCVEDLDAKYRYVNARGERAAPANSVLAIEYGDAKAQVLIQVSYGPSWGTNRTFLMPYAWTSDFAATSDFWTIRASEDGVQNSMSWEQVHENLLGNQNAGAAV